MRTYDIKTIRGANAVIHCKTYDEAEALYRLVNYHHSYNYVSRIISKWDMYGSKTCYQLNAAGMDGVSWCSKDWYEANGFEIIQYTDLKPLTT